MSIAPPPSRTRRPPPMGEARTPRRSRRRSTAGRWLFVIGLLAGLLVGTWSLARPAAVPSGEGDVTTQEPEADDAPDDADDANGAPDTGGADGPAVAADPDDAALPPPEPGVVDARLVGRPWGGGLTMFRGNPTRTWYGTGPVPTDPEVLWRFPDEGPLCGTSTVGGEPLQWCGTGWTGQPVVHELADGRTEVIVGAYDRAVHFLDAATGERTRPDFPVGDIIKGSVSLDPDGYPLLYVGARDDRLRVIALDRDVPTELWHLPAHPDLVWNNDFDGNPVILDDVLFEGGEDSWFHAVKLNRAYGEDGLVTVAPQVLTQVPGFNEALFDAVGDTNVSIESSVAVFEDTVYFANSGGRVVGLDISAVEEGAAPVVFDYWMGDDVDATVVVDEEGMLYVSAELERFLPRAAEVGQLVKLDPRRPDDPRVWGLAVGPNDRGTGYDNNGGLWATPALHAGTLYAATHGGDLLAVDTDNGEVTWSTEIGAHAWSSPLVVDGTLVVATCEDPSLRAWDVSGGGPPVERWTARGPDGCIESTPAMWEGRLYVGSRDGYIYAFGDRSAP